jgi:hypothetical protein
VIATVAAVACTWTAVSIPAAVLIGRRLRHLEDHTMPSYEDTYDRIAALTAERDGAYRERAHLLAWLATHYPAIMVPALDLPEAGWWLLYITAPTGQLSWHISPRDAGLLAHVQRVEPDDPRAQWDGHTTEQKYDRIRALRLHAAEHPEAPQDSDDNPAVADTLPAWLCNRYRNYAFPFDNRTWEQLSGEDRSYWEHEAAAVRRAVDRGGFKAQPASPDRS